MTQDPEAGRRELVRILVEQLVDEFLAEQQEPVVAAAPEDAQNPAECAP